MADKRDIQARIAGWIAARRPSDGTLVVGIDGPGAAGKSTLAADLARRLDAAVVAVDDFYRPAAERSTGDQDGWGADFDDARLRAEVLEPLAAGAPARYGVYDWGEDRVRAGERCVSGPIVLVEGVYVLRPSLRPFYGLTLWVHAPRDERLRRGLKRDGEPERDTWELDWMPQEDRYLAAVNPRASADLVLDASVSPPVIVRGPDDV